MLRNIFTKTLRDQRRPLLWWSLGLVTLTLITILYYPAVRATPALNQMMQDMPEGLRSLFGGGDIVSPAGYLTAELFALMVPLLFLIYAVNLGVGAIAGEEERGTLELLLALPVSRRRVVVEKFAALVGLLAALSLVLWLTLWLGARSVDMAIGGDRLAAATTNTALLALTLGALGLALGAGTGRRGLSLGICAAIAAGGYVWNGLAPLVEALAPLRRLSLFYYALASEPLRNGLDPGHAAVLGGTTVILFAVALLGLDRRDVAV
jgi:ABC-2 type transport system permease protein